MRTIRTSRNPVPDDEPLSEPTPDEVRREYQLQPVQPDEEVTELVGLCLWDIFSDNHDVVAADGRVAEIGSFRGAGAFLDEYLTRNRDTWCEGDYLRFYLSTIGIAGRADLTPVYTMIFRRLKTRGADWIDRFPELGVVDLTPLHADAKQQPTGYSVSEAAVAELKAQQRRIKVERFRSELAEMNRRARGEAMDRPPPATVLAYRLVYRRNPQGWPPA